MTTNAAPAEKAPRILLAAAAWVLVSTVALGLGALLAAGRTEASSAFVGGGVVLVFFTFGAVVVGTAARLAPATAVLIAMITYTLQVVLVALVFVGLTEADAFAGPDRSLSSGWLAAALIAGTFAWMAGQVTATLRAPIAPWDGPVLDGPGADGGSGTPGQEVDAA